MNAFLTRIKWDIVLFSVLLLSYVVNAMDRQLFSILATDVRASLEISLPEIGLASTIFTLGMGVAGLPAGFLLTKCKRKTVVIVGLVIFSVATFLTAYSNNLYSLLVYRFFSGLGEAMQLTALLAIATMVFYRHRAIAASSLNFTFGVGAIIGPNLGAVILNLYNWKMPFIIFGLAGIPCLILILLFVPSHFTEINSMQVKLPESANDKTDTGSFLQLQPMLLIISTMLSGLSIYGYLGLYPTYLREAIGFNSQQAAVIVSFYGLGALLSLAGGWLGDKFNYRHILFISFFISAVTGCFLFMKLDKSVLTYSVLSFAFGGSISGMVYANLSAGLVKCVPAIKASLASGIFVASMYIPAAFAGYLLGSLKECIGWTSGGMIQISGCALLAGLLSLIKIANR